MDRGGHGRRRGGRRNRRYAGVAAVAVLVVTAVGVAASMGSGPVAAAWKRAVCEVEGAVGGACSTPAEPAQGPDPTTDPVREARRDLASRLDLPAEEVTLVSAEDVTWRNGSLGCAEPGRFYTMALVEGTRVVLRSAGETYEYHSGGGRTLYCEKPTE